MSLILIVKILGIGSLLSDRSFFVLVLGCTQLFLESSQFWGRVLKRDPWAGLGHGWVCGIGLPPAPSFPVGSQK